MAQSYYKTIHGTRYDRALLGAADERIAGQGDGRISEKDAEELVELSKDGGRVTETELRTLKYIREHYRFTPKAAAWFAGQLPAIEQAVHPEKLAQPQPPHSPPPPPQAPAPPPEPPPAEGAEPAAPQWPQEVMATEASSASPIPHVIWGVLLLASIIIGVVFYQGAAEQAETLKAQLDALPDTQLLEQQVANLQSEQAAMQTTQGELRTERNALQAQVENLNQQLAGAQNQHDDLQKRFEATSNRLEIAGSKISGMQSEVQSLHEQLAQAEQVALDAQAAQAVQDETPQPTPEPTKSDVAPSVAAVLRVLQENALAHSEAFKITSLQLDASLEGFKFNEAILLPEHKELLDRLVPLLKPLEVQLKLIGHTDSTGNYSAVNLFLSHRRALVASQYITEKLGFPRSRIYATGRAHLKPTAENTSRSTRLKNRRVDLHLEIRNGHPPEKLP